MAILRSRTNIVVVSYDVIDNLRFGENLLQILFSTMGLGDVAVLETAQLLWLSSFSQGNSPTMVKNHCRGKFTLKWKVKERKRCLLSTTILLAQINATL